jgi:ABC-2 type transport system ATP-binding protein
MSDARPVVEDGIVRVAVRRRPRVVVEAVRRLDDAGIDVEDVSVRRPTLDDVFLVLTGRAAEEASAERAAARAEEARA